MRPTVFASLSISQFNNILIARPYLAAAKSRWVVERLAFRLSIEMP